MNKKDTKIVLDAITKIKSYIDRRFSNIQEEMKEVFVSTLKDKHFKKLNTYFLNLDTFGGIQINKDNCEDLFEYWFENLTTTEIIRILETYEEKTIY